MNAGAILNPKEVGSQTFLVDNYENLIGWELAILMRNANRASHTARCSKDRQRDGCLPVPGRLARAALSSMTRDNDANY
jgi:hypothetical protein